MVQDGDGTGASNDYRNCADAAAAAAHEGNGGERRVTRLRRIWGMMAMRYKAGDDDHDDDSWTLS